MNKYKLKEHLECSLKKYKTTLKAVSHDSENGEYLCTDESVEVYDFDRYVEACREAMTREEAHRTPASPDAICVSEKNLYFIEFKNQKKSSIDRPRIRNKFEEGTQQLKKLLQPFTPKDCRYYFCVVYKGEPSRFPYSRYRQFESRAVHFDLDELNRTHGGFYDQVITQDVDFYKEKFKQLKC